MNNPDRKRKKLTKKKFKELVKVIKRELNCKEYFIRVPVEGEDMKNQKWIDCVCGKTYRRNLLQCPKCGSTKECEHDGEQKNGVCLDCGKI